MTDATLPPFDDPSWPRFVRRWARIRARGPERYLVRTVLAYVVLTVAIGAGQRLWRGGPPFVGSLPSHALGLAVVVMTGMLLAAFTWAWSERAFQRALHERALAERARIGR